MQDSTGNGGRGMPGPFGYTFQTWLALIDPLICALLLLTLGLALIDSKTYAYQLLWLTFFLRKCYRFSNVWYAAEQVEDSTAFAFCFNGISALIGCIFEGLAPIESIFAFADAAPLGSFFVPLSSI